MKHVPWGLKWTVSCLGLKLNETPTARATVKQTSLLEYICILLIVKLG